MNGRGRIGRAPVEARGGAAQRAGPGGAGSACARRAPRRLGPSLTNGPPPALRSPRRCGSRRARRRAASAARGSSVARSSSSASARSRPPGSPTSGVCDGDAGPGRLARRSSSRPAARSPRRAIASFSGGSSFVITGMPNAIDSYSGSPRPSQRAGATQTSLAAKRCRWSAVASSSIRTSIRESPSAAASTGFSCLRLTCVFTSRRRRSSRVRVERLDHLLDRLSVAEEARRGRRFAPGRPARAGGAFADRHQLGVTAPGDVGALDPHPGVPRPARRG